MEKREKVIFEILELLNTLNTKFIERLEYECTDEKLDDIKESLTESLECYIRI